MTYMSRIKRTEPSVEREWGDSRDTTRRNRIAIGFARNRQVWRHAHALFSKSFLKILGHPVMEAWETPYMKELAKIAISRGGIILEVGYGMGISARYIQKTDIERHIIMEVNHEVAQRAREFQKKAKHVVDVLEGFWDETIHLIPDNSIDGILFDTYPLSKREIHKNHFKFFKSAFQKLKVGGVFTYYSDEIDAFSSAHLKKLIQVGFKRENIQGKLVRVSPPSECEYWKSNTILAPIVIK